MDILAVLAIRNGRPYAGNCLAHLISQGISYAIIDHGSTDDLLGLLRSFPYRSRLVDYVRFPDTGVFELRRQLEEKERIIARSGADWAIHLDVDEMMYSSRNEALAQALERADRSGWTAVNFDEFVFLPIDHDYVPDLYAWQPMTHYYFYEFRNPFLMRAFKVGCGASLVENAGHILSGANVRLSPESLVLRHYPFRSQADAISKYACRVYHPGEVGHGWHFDRHGQLPGAFEFPPASRLKKLRVPSDRRLDRSDPRPQHYWQWPSS